MIPAAFDYKRASSAAEAISLVGQYGDEAKFLAGGHSLIPLMKLRLAQPAMLIDIGRIKDLSYIKDGGDFIAIGALTRHMDVEKSALVLKEVPLLAHAAGYVGDAQVRHRGTIGGSLAHADSASDLPATTLALGATYVAQGPKGERLIAAADFYKGFLESALQPDEMLTEIRVPKMNGAKWGFEKFNRRAQDWAIVGVAAWRSKDASGVALVNMGSTPILATSVSAALKSGASVADAAEKAAAEAEPQDDLNASSEYRVHLAKVLVRRALEKRRHNDFAKLEDLSVATFLRRKPTRTRVVAIALYLALFAWSIKRFGLPVDRIAVTGWVLVAFIFANVGKTRKDQFAMLRDWSIFAGMLFAYEYSRGLSDQLGRPISYLAVRNFDRALFFGTDPNVWMQQHLNISKVLSWYEYPLAVTYMTHFIFPPGVAVLLWWINRDMWVRYVRRLGILFFMACATFAAFPVAPPWLTAKQGYMAPIQRITARAWSHMGIKSVSKVFDRGTAITNPYAAMPSLHAACALLVVLFFFPYMPKWLRVVSLALPGSMALCLVYFGEHYVADILAGWLYVGFAFWISSKWENRKSGSVKVSTRVKK